MTRTRLLTIALLSGIAFLVPVGIGGAAWVITSSGTGYSKALTMPIGATPTLSTSTNNVTVSWAASTIGGAAVDGYTVKRYDTANVPQSIGASCTGLVASTSCTESSVPAGHWKYTVMPKKEAWVGGESAYSTAVHVVAAPNSVSCGNCGGVGSAYINSSMSTSVTVNVALPSSSEAADTVHLTLTDGTNTVTPATKGGTAGAGTVTWTGISTATLSQGTITFRAWVTASTGEASPNTTSTSTKDTLAPTATDIQTINKTGGTGGRMETGDQVVYTFSEQMDPASLLTGWNGSATTVTISVTNNAGLDPFTISSASYGTVTTNGNYVAANLTWTGSTMVQSGARVTITLGSTSGGSNLRTNGTAANMSWAGSVSAKDLGGNAMSTTARTETGGLDLDF